MWAEPLGTVDKVGMEGADSPRAVRIATLNTSGMRGNWTERRRVLSDGLLALDADLLTLQETIVDNGYDQAADVLGSRYEIIHQQDRESDGQGISTASRWPVGEIIELDINVTGRRRLRLRQPHHRDPRPAPA